MDTRSSTCQKLTHNLNNLKNSWIKLGIDPIWWFSEEGKNFAAIIRSIMIHLMTKRSGRDVVKLLSIGLLRLKIRKFRKKRGRENKNKRMKYLEEMIKKEI